ncbi:MAG: SDR family NAD(P)-dependent oxidoreductase, partial [Hymenobacter sp.]
MNLSHNTILLTGGASGIGLALAQRLRAAGSDVIICGRRADKLREAQQQVPGLHIYETDLAEPLERAALVRRVLADFPQLNVLLNNAGIQNRLQLADMPADLAAWEMERQEIAINFDAPVHLTALLLPYLRQQANAAIINVTSGLAFAPLAAVPVY